MLVNKIARSLAAVAVTAAPFVMMSAPTAHAAGGCTVSNTSTQTNINVEIHIPTPPALPTVNPHWSNLTCSYVSEGGSIQYSCVVTGRCEIYRNGALVASCNTAGRCSGTLPTPANPGDVITLVVIGGTGAVNDAV